MSPEADKARNAIQSIGRVCDECAHHSYEAVPASFGTVTFVGVLCAVHGLGEKPRASACTDFVLVPLTMISLEP